MYIYILTSKFHEGLYKIGKANNVYKRAKEMNSIFPEPIVSVLKYWYIDHRDYKVLEIEKVVHSLFSEQRVLRGENNISYDYISKRVQSKKNKFVTVKYNKPSLTEWFKLNDSDLNFLFEYMNKKKYNESNSLQPC